MSDSFYKSEMDREMLLNIEIQKQNLKSLPEKFKPQKKTVSPVTQQMIDDYKLQFRNMYERKGEDGKKQFYKFLIPEALPTLESTDERVLRAGGYLEPVLTDRQKIARNNELNDLLDEYNRNEQVTIPDEIEKIKKYRNRINELTDRRQGLIRDYGRNAVEIADIERRINNLTVKITTSENTITTITTENINNKTNIDNLKYNLEINEENKIKNENVIYTIEQNNKKKLADYAKTLRIMNEGQINIEQAPGESEIDFLKRLADVALIEEDLTRASLYNTNEFKKNLKTIIKSEWKIENLVKSFNNDNQFLLNKTFAGFKKYFNNVYGTGNQNLEVEDYIALINAYLDSEGPKLIKGKTKEGETKEGETKGETKGEIEEETKAVDLPEDELDDIFGDAPAPAPAPAVAIPVDELPEVEARALPPPPIRVNERTLQNIKISKIGDVLRYENTRFENKSDTTNVYFKLSDPPNKGSGSSSANNIVNYSYDDINYEEAKKGAAFNGNFKTIIKKINPNDNDFSVIIYKITDDENINGRKVTVSRFIDFFNSIKSGGGLKRNKKPTRGKPKKKPVVQKGASIKTVPTHCQFGKTIILLNKLYQNNILSVKDSNNINIQGIPNSKVSDKFVNIILSICNDEEVNTGFTESTHRNQEFHAGQARGKPDKDIDTLPEKDFILINVLMKKAGLTKKYNIDNTKAIKLLKDRLELVEGQILAGNTNEEIKKELYDIVFKLANIGATNLSSSRKYYKDVVKLMF